MRETLPSDGGDIHERNAGNTLAITDVGYRRLGARTVWKRGAGPVRTVWPGKGLPALVRENLEERFRAGTDVKFLVDVADVGSHRFNADAQFVGDLLVEQALGEVG